MGLPSLALFTHLSYRNIISYVVKFRIRLLRNAIILDATGTKQLIGQFVWKRKLFFSPYAHMFLHKPACQCFMGIISTLMGHSEHQYCCSDHFLLLCRSYCFDCFTATCFLPPWLPSCFGWCKQAGQCCHRVSELSYLWQFKDIPSVQ